MQESEQDEWGICVEEMEHEQGEEGVHMWKAAQQRVSEHEWSKERLPLRGQPGMGY